MPKVIARVGSAIVSIGHPISAVPTHRESCHEHTYRQTFDVS